jgi:exopolyphosphatase/guanosine-5'-triphosphate,3'-diphosphate pyrophosphatase
VGILSGPREASLVLDSVRARIPRLRPTLMVVDIGGGSAQLVVARGARTILVRSVPLGAVVLTERYLRSDPIDYFEYITMRHRIDATISRLFARLPHFAPGTVDLVVAGGTATTAAAMTGAGTRASHVSLRVSQLLALQMRVVEATVAERLLFPGLPPDRADIMPAGLAVLLSFARHARKRSVKIAAGGWRDGVILERARRAARSPRKNPTTARAKAAARKGR